MAAMDRVAENLGRGMRMIAAALAPTEIVVVGEITSAWHTIGPKVELSLRQSSLARSIRV
jgi:predicted NBD/HSP70 family sugar kinase